MSHFLFVQNGVFQEVMIFWLKVLNDILMTAINEHFSASHLFIRIVSSQPPWRFWKLVVKGFFLSVLDLAQMSNVSCAESNSIPIWVIWHWFRHWIKCAPLCWIVGRKGIEIHVIYASLCISFCGSIFTIL